MIRSFQVKPALMMHLTLIGIFHVFAHHVKMHFPTFKYKIYKYYAPVKILSAEGSGGQTQLNLKGNFFQV